MYFKKIKNNKWFQIITRVLTKIGKTIVLGITTGLIVSYLLSTPVISLKDSGVFVDNNKLKIKTIYENKGKSPALNVTTQYLYGRDGDSINNFITLKKSVSYKIGIGEEFSYEVPGIPLLKGRYIVIMQIRFNDESKIREYLNKKLFGNPYSLDKWGQYIEGKNILFGINEAQNKIYKNEICKNNELLNN